MKKTATLLALAGLSMAAKSENHHSSLRHPKVVDHTPESDPYVTPNPTNQPKEAINNDDELLLIYKPRFDIDPGMIIRPPRDDIDRGILAKPRPANQFLYVDDELSLFNVHALEHHGRSRGGWHLASAQEPLDSKWNLAYKEGDKNAIDKPKDIGGMIVKEKGVFVTDKHADDELLFDIKPLDFGEIRRGGKSADDELLLVSAQSVDQTRTRGYSREIKRKLRGDEHADSELCQKTDSVKPKEVGGMIIKEKGVYIQYGRHDDADSELSWFDTKPVDGSSSRRPNILTIPPKVYLWSVNDELAVLGDLLNDN